MKIYKIIVVYLVFLILPNVIWAANYDVTWDGGGRTEVDGDTFCAGVCQPGDTITLPSGTTNDGLYIRDLHGADGNPIIIRNTSGAQTILDTNDVRIAPVYGNGIWIYDSDFIKIDGSNGYTTGNLDLSNPTAYEFGIRVTDTAYRGVFINYGSEEIEVQYLEIDNIGYAGYGTLGIGIEEDTSIGQVPEDTVLNGLYVHHNYVHDTGTEGMYLGNTGSCVSQTCCNSKDDYDDAVIWTGVEVHDNRTDNTGWDGIQTGCCETSLVYGNFVTNAGEDQYGGTGQGSGISLNRGFGGSVYGNKIIGTQKQGIIWQGAAATDIYNNLVADAGEMSTAAYYERIGFDDAGGVDAETLTIRYNTFAKIAKNAFKIETSQTGIAQDNLVANAGAADQWGSTFVHTNYGVTKATVAECNFVNPNGDDYHLSGSTPGDILDAGQGSGYPATDLDGVNRPQNGTVDLGAYEYNTSNLTLSWPFPTAQKGCNEVPVSMGFVLSSNDAYCRTSTTITDGYTDMSDQFTLGEGGTTTHAILVSQSCGTIVDHYVICNTAADGSGTDSDQYTIPIDVASSGGSPPPPWAVYGNGITFGYGEGGITVVPQ